MSFHAGYLDVQFRGQHKESPDSPAPRSFAAGSEKGSIARCLRNQNDDPRKGPCCAWSKDLVIVPPISATLLEGRGRWTDRYLV
jgi:hypothetical protein